MIAALQPSLTVRWSTLLLRPLLCLYILLFAYHKYRLMV